MSRPQKKSYFFLILGLAIVGVVCFAALFAPLLTTNDPMAMNLPLRFHRPSLLHPFGLDENGGDVYAKVLFGARVSLLVAFSVVFISTCVGLLIGSLSGYYGGRTDQLFMRAIDIVQAFPGILLALAIISVLGPSIPNLIIAMCATSWAGFARLIRGEILYLKHMDYVDSAKAMGASNLRILIKHIWPNLTGPIVVNATFAMAGAIISESSLSFLGLGAPATTATWGSLLNSGRRILLEAPHVSIFPGLAILTLILGFNFIGDALRDYFDPKKT